MILESEKNGIIHADESTMINAIPIRFKKLGEISFLCSGSTGQVFKISGEQEYALKIVQCGNSESKYQKALYELHVMDDLKGESRIVQLCDYEIVDTEGNITVYLLEKFHISLKEYLQNRTLYTEDLIRLIIGVCDSLLVCKKNNVLHLDVQPDNIYVDDSASVKLGDFSHSLRTSDLPENHSARGTMAFMAPEVFRDGKCSEQSDLYSVGLLLYMLFNHMELPFMASGQKEVSIYKRLAGTPLPDVPVENRELQKDIGRIIERACSFDPMNRYDSLTELKSALGEVCDRVKTDPEKNVPIYSVMESEDTHLLPVIYVLQTTEEVQGLPDSELNTIVRKSLAVIKAKASIYGIDIRVSILLCGSSAEWLYFNSPSDALHLEFSPSGESVFSSALEELNDKLSTQNEDSLLCHAFYRPVIVFVSDGSADDDCGAALSRLERNLSFENANKIFFNLGKEHAHDFLKELAGARGTILNAETISYFEAQLHFIPFVADSYGKTLGSVTLETSAAIWNSSNISDWKETVAPPMGCLSMVSNDQDDKADWTWNRPFSTMDGTGEESLRPQKATTPTFDFNANTFHYDTLVDNSARRCRVCNNRIDDGTRFCPHCGSKVILENTDVDIRKVEFSAIAPKRLIKGDYSIIKVVMYEKTARDAVDSIIKEMGEQAQETRSGMHEVKDSSRITVVLTSPDIEIDDNMETGVWQGDYLVFGFSVLLPERYDKRQLLLTASIYINDMIATKLKFVVKCFSLLEQKIEVSREDVLSAFVSYASQDRNRVATIIQGMKKARPDMDVFFDVDSLRCGEDWEEALHNEIEKRDVLFLCWSHYARESKWVDLEWRYALEKKGADCIEPVPIESPDNCPPPAELKHKHFNDKLLYIINSDKNFNADDKLADEW